MGVYVGFINVCDIMDDLGDNVLFLMKFGYFVLWGNGESFFDDGFDFLLDFIFLGDFFKIG